MRESQYRALKKRLNAYHKFRFSMPKKGKNFTPAQKSALTRQWNKLSDYILRVNKDRATFIKKPKGVSLKKIPQAMKTNKGIFYPQGGASLKIKKVKGRKQVQLQIKFAQYIEKYFRFPTDIMGDMEMIQLYVESLVRRYNPTYIMMAINEFLGKVRYAPEVFYHYQSELMVNRKFKKDYEKSSASGKDFFTGVFIGFEKVM